MDNPNNQQKPAQNQPKPQAKPQPTKPQQPQSQRQSVAMQILAAFVVGILVGVIGVSIFNKRSSPLYSTAGMTTATTSQTDASADTNASLAVSTSPANPTTPTIISASTNNDISVSDQPAGSSVTIDQVDFQAPSWVAIQADVDGKPGIIFGTGLFPAGQTTNGTVSLIQPTVSGTSYFAVLHFSSSPTSKTFNWKTDVTIDDNTGHPVMTQFTAQ